MVQCLRAPWGSVALISSVTLGELLSQTCSAAPSRALFFPSPGPQQATLLPWTPSRCSLAAPCLGFLLLAFPWVSCDGRYQQAGGGRPGYLIF